MWLCRVAWQPCKWNLFTFFIHRISRDPTYRLYLFLVCYLKSFVNVLYSAYNSFSVSAFLLLLNIYIHMYECVRISPYIFKYDFRFSQKSLTYAFQTVTYVCACVTTYLPDRPTDIVCTATVADSDLSVGTAAGGTGSGPTVEVVVRSQHSRSGNSLQRTKCNTPKRATQVLRQQQVSIFRFFILKRVISPTREFCVGVVIQLLNLYGYVSSCYCCFCYWRSLE